MELLKNGELCNSDPARAIDDIRESIAELKYYRNSIFKIEKS